MKKKNSLRKKESAERKTRCPGCGSVNFKNLENSFYRKRCRNCGVFYDSIIGEKQFKLYRNSNNCLSTGR